jgi:hypothetical protein
VAVATHLVIGAISAALDDSVRFPDEFSIAVGTFALG